MSIKYKVILALMRNNYENLQCQAILVRHSFECQGEGKDEESEGTQKEERKRRRAERPKRKKKRIRGRRWIQLYEF